MSHSSWKRTAARRLLPLLFCLSLVLTGGLGVQGDDPADNGAAAGSSETNGTGASASGGDVLVSAKAYASAEERLADMEQVAKSGDTTLYIDRRTADIAVVDQRNGAAYFSSPYGAADDHRATDDIRNRLLSQLRVEYYTQSGQLKDANSYVECIQKNQFAIELIENGVRINLTLGREEQTMLLPSQLPAESFETYILPYLEGRELKRIQAFYKKYDLSEATDSQREDWIKSFPYLETGPVYVLKNVTNKEKQELEKYIKKTGYTTEQMAVDYEAVGGSQDDMYFPYFKIPVEYRLESGQLLASIPADEIEYDSTHFSLYRLHLLEYFAAGKTGEDGYLFFPDGPGAIFRFNNDGTKSNAYITGKVYGQDAVISSKSIVGNKADISLPVYGIKNGDGAVFGILEEGASMADLSIQLGDISSSYNSAFPTFTYRTRDDFTFDDVMKQTTWSVLDKNAYTGRYTVRFLLLAGDDADYSGMAGAYRDYLTKKGVLTSDIARGDNIPLYATMLGMVRHTERFLGVPYNAEVKLTTFDDAQTILSDLSSRGVKSLNARLLGWANGGLENTAFSSLKVLGSLGGKKDLKALGSYTAENGFGLFPDMEFTYVAKTAVFDGFNARKNAAKQLDEKYAGVMDINPGTSLFDRETFRYLLRPSTAKAYFAKTFGQFQKLALPGVSLGSLGGDLGSDMRSSELVNRAQAQAYVTARLETAAGASSVLVDKGNDYVLPYADHILNLPITGSRHNGYDAEIPFYQMVIHGSKSYALAPLNINEDPETAVLRSVEYGAGLNFVFAYRNSDVLKDTRYSSYYSVDYAMWAEQAASIYSEVNGVLSRVNGSRMIRHEYALPNVAKVTYDNGTSIYVNYTAEDVSLDGLTIPAKGYTASR